MLARIVKDLEQAAPVIVKMRGEAARREVEQQKQREAERRELDRKEVERRKEEGEKRQREELRQQVDGWSFARDARAMVTVRSMLATRGPRLVRGGDEEKWTKLVLEEAEAVDPLAKLRDDADAMAKEFGTSPRPPSPLGSMRRLRRRQRAVHRTRFR